MNDFYAIYVLDFTIVESATRSIA